MPSSRRFSLFFSKEFPAAPEKFPAPRNRESAVNPLNQLAEGQPLQQKSA
jgi:hypothetical protein